MKKMIAACLIVLLFGAVAHAEILEENDLRIEIEPMYLFRVASSDYTMMYNNDSFRERSMAWRDFNSGNIINHSAMGVQGGLTWWFTESFGVELAGFWTDKASSSCTVHDPVHFWGGSDLVYDQTPGKDFITGNSSGLDVFEYTFETQLFGVEANLVGNFGEDLEWLEYFVGFRYIQYTEDLSTTAYDEYHDYNGQDNDIDWVGITSRNDLYGAQIGVDLEYELLEGLTVGSDAWFALFRNTVTVSRTFESADVTGMLRDDSMSETNWAHGFGFSPELSYKPCDYVALTLGGDFMYLAGISMSAAYFKTVSDLDDDILRPYDNVLYLGAHAGFVIFF